MRRRPLRGASRLLTRRQPSELREHLGERDGNRLGEGPSRIGELEREPLGKEVRRLAPAVKGPIHAGDLKADLGAPQGEVGPPSRTCPVLETGDARSGDAEPHRKASHARERRRTSRPIVGDDDEPVGKLGSLRRRISERRGRVNEQEVALSRERGDDLGDIWRDELG